MLCPECDMKEDTFVLNVGDRKKIDAYANKKTDGEVWIE